MGPVEGQLLGDFFGLEIGRKWNVTTCELRLDGSYYGGCEEFTTELMSSQNLGDVLAFEFIVDQFGEYQTTLKALKEIMLISLLTQRTMSNSFYSYLCNQEIS